VRASQGEVARAERVGPVLEQQMQVLVAQVEPEDDEVEGARPGNLLQAQQIAIEAPASLHVGDDDGYMIDLTDFEVGHGVVVTVVARVVRCVGRPRVLQLPQFLRAPRSF
jgi:hypothetical protein